MSDQEPVEATRLGPGGISTSLLGLGSWNTWDRMAFDDAVDLLVAGVDAGITLFDVAQYTMGPHAEQARTDVIFGEAVRAAGLDRTAFQWCGKLWLWDYPATGFEEQMETSLSRVGLTRADAVVVGDYVERPDIHQVVTDVAEQIRRGRFDCWGVNNWPADDLDAAFAFAEREGMPPPSFAQLKYGIVRRSMAEGPRYGAYFSSGKLALQASDVFEGGVLLGNAFPDRKIGADPGGIRAAVRRAAEGLAGVAAELDATPAQMAIAYCLRHPATRNVLFGVSSRRQLEENIGALRLWRDHGAQVREAVDGFWLDTDVPADGRPVSGDS